MSSELTLTDLPYERVGLIADVHDNLGLLNKALTMLTDRGIDTVLFAGDFCSPIVAGEMIKFPGCIHAVWGNGDGDRVKIQQIADTRPGILLLHGEFAHFQMVGRDDVAPKIALTHYWFYAQALVRTGDYSLVVSGHSHERRKVAAPGRAWCVNPGEIMNWKGKASFAIYDPEKRDVEFVELT